MIDFMYLWLRARLNGCTDDAVSACVTLVALGLLSLLILWVKTGVF